MPTKPKWLLRDIAAPAPYYTLVLSQAEFDAELKRLGIPKGTAYLSSSHANATTSFLEAPNGARCAIVGLGSTDKRTGVEIAGLLVHEAVHIWQEYCKHIGEENPASEQEAYAIQYIAGRLMEEFARRLGEGVNDAA
jgi:hypothetical protein